MEKEYPESKRLKKVYECLLKEGLVDSSADFAEKISYKHRNTFNNMLLGRRGVPTSVKLQVVKVFGVSKDYIFYGKGDMFTKAVKGVDPIIELLQRIKDLEKRVKKLEGNNK